MFRTSRWWYQALAPYLVPRITGSAPWSLRGSLWLGLSSNTLGHSTARPFLGATFNPRRGKSVSPPSSTSLR